MTSADKLLVAVVGTTGVGKSQLAIELAQHVASRSHSAESSGSRQYRYARAEIINADAMQCYRGLDVVTNKVTADEAQGVTHHLMSFLDVHDKDYNVVEWQRDALRKVDELHSHDTLPIAVGGTTYYLQSLIFPNQLVKEPEVTPRTPREPSRTERRIDDLPPLLRDRAASLPTELLQLLLIHPSLPSMSTPDDFPPGFPIDRLPRSFRTPEAFTKGVRRLLEHMDPENAARWHWRDVRKIRRGIDIVWEGKTWSDIMREQADTAPRARYRTLVFWPFARKDVLDRRLDERVDKMLTRGLLDDLRTMWRAANPGTDPSETDYSTGIFQTIGYKEFSPYLRQLHGESQLDTRDPLFQQGLVEMKVSTRQYAKRQVKWIKSKLLPLVADLPSGEVDLYLFDASDVEKWSENVSNPARELLDRFLANEAMPDGRSLSSLAAEHLIASEMAPVRKRRCDLCTEDEDEPFLVDEVNWEAHVRSKRHKKLLRGDRQAWIDEQRALARTSK